MARLTKRLALVIVMIDLPYGGALTPKPISYSEEAPDAEAYYALFETTGWNTKYQASSADLAEAIAHSWYHISGYDGDHLVGFGRIVCDRVMHAIIFDLIVHPSHQRRGIGSQILKRLLFACREAGITDVQLFAAQGMAPFYEKHGFAARPGNAPGMELSRDIPSQSRRA